MPKQDDFASKHNFTNFQFLNENTDGHQAKASPQVIFVSYLINVFFFFLKNISEG